MSKTQSQLEIELQQESELLLKAALQLRLKMTYEQRIEAHENARELCEQLKQAGEALCAKPQNAS